MQTVFFTTTVQLAPLRFVVVIVECVHAPRMYVTVSCATFLRVFILLFASNFGVGALGSREG